MRSRPARACVCRHLPLGQSTPLLTLSYMQAQGRRAVKHPPKLQSAPKRACGQVVWRDRGGCRRRLHHLRTLRSGREKRAGTCNWAWVHAIAIRSILPAFMCCMPSAAVSSPADRAQSTATWPTEWPAAGPQRCATCGAVWPAALQLAPGSRQCVPSGLAVPGRMWHIAPGGGCRWSGEERHQVSLRLVTSLQQQASPLDAQHAPDMSGWPIASSTRQLSSSSFPPYLRVLRLVVQCDGHQAALRAATSVQHTAQAAQFGQQPMACHQATHRRLSAGAHRRAASQQQGLKYIPGSMALRLHRQLTNSRSKQLTSNSQARGTNSP